jgi:hypothetical protein
VPLILREACGFYVFMTSADTFNSFLKILTLPFQVGSQRFIEGDSRILAMSPRMFLQLGLAFWLEGN